MSRFVAVLMGSDSDLSVMQEALNVLEAFHLTYEVRILSAHRTPDATRDFVTDAESRGCGAHHAIRNWCRASI